MPRYLPDIFVIRHGETQWNVAGRLQGRQNTPLTVNGTRQAIAVGLRLAERIGQRSKVKYWTSPLGRAEQTASILADTWHISFDSFERDAALVERAYGDWEGLSHAAIETERPDQYVAYSADRWDYAMPNGESQSALTARLSGWMNALDGDTTHVVVTHSGCLRALRGIYTNAARETVLGYREPQTTAVLLAAGGETLLDVPPAMLSVLGCEGQGRTVWI